MDTLWIVNLFWGLLLSLGGLVVKGIRDEAKELREEVKHAAEERHELGEKLAATQAEIAVLTEKHKRLDRQYDSLHNWKNVGVQALLERGWENMYNLIKSDRVDMYRRLERVDSRLEELKVRLLSRERGNDRNNPSWGDEA